MKHVLLITISVLLLTVACETVPEFSLMVETCPVEDILYNPQTGFTEVIVHGKITGDESLVRERGFIWAKEDKFNTSVIAIQSNEPYSVTFSNLEKDKEYFVKAYVRSTRGDVFGEYLSFRSISPIILRNVTNEEKDINGNFITVRGEFVSDGGVTPSRYGVRISETLGGTPTEYLADNLANGMFSVDILDVKSNTDYYVEVFAENPVGEVQTEPKKIHTLSLALPEVAIDETRFIDIKPQSLTLRCKILSNGNDYATTYGVYYGASKDAINTEIKALEMETDTTYVLTADQLETGTKYYFSAYAKNSVGTFLSEADSASTLKQAVPMVSIGEVVQGESFTYDWAELTGSIIDDGGLTVTERGFYVGKDTLSMTKYVSSVESVDYTADISGLDQATKYYYTSYAVNAKGEGRCKEFKSFYTGVLDKEIYERDDTMGFKTNKLIYYMMDPVRVKLAAPDSVDLFVLDRNIGATKVATGSTYDYKACGYYFRWGSFLPQASADMVWLASYTGTQNTQIPVVNGELYNGWGIQLQNTNYEDVSWRAAYEADPPRAANPCPAGFHILAMNEISALIVATKSSTESQFADWFHFCLSGGLDPEGKWAAIVQWKIWLDDAVTTGAQPAACQFQKSTFPNYATLARVRALPVRCVKDY